MNTNISKLSVGLSISECLLQRTNQKILSLNSDMHILELNMNDQQRYWEESVDEVETVTGDLAKKKRE